MIWRTILLLVLMSGLSVRAVNAQDPNRLSRFGERYDAFRSVLAYRGVTVRTLDDLPADADEWKNWAVVVVGDPEPLEILPIPLVDFVSRGGRLLVATDQPSRILALQFGLQIERGPVTVPIGPSAYQGFENCPLVTNVFKDHPLFTRVESLVFNLPGYLIDRIAPGNAIAWFPRDAEVNGVRPDQPLVAMVHGEVGSGGWLFIADQSVLINEMILEPNNLFFAANIVNWLVGMREGSELNVVFLEEGQAVSELIDPRFAAGDWDDMNLAELLGLVNQVIAGLQEENAFNEILTRAQQRIRRNLVRPWVFLLPTLFLIALTVLVVAHCALPSEPSRHDASGAEQSDDTVAAAATSDYRDRQLCGSGAAACTRVLLALAAGSSGPAPMPPLKIDAGLWTRLQIAMAMRNLWRLASGESIGFVGRRRFSRIVSDMARIDHLAGRGIIRFGPVLASKK